MEVARWRAIPRAEGYPRNVLKKRVLAEVAVALTVVAALVRDRALIDS